MAKDPVEVKIKMRKVRVVSVTGPAALVETTDGLTRATIPANEIVDGAVSEEALDLGVPYGLTWERLVKLSATPEQIARELRRNGIWTLEDLERNPRAALGAIQSVYGVELSTLLLAAHEEVKHGKR